MSVIVDLFKVLRDSGLLTAAFIIGALALILAIVGNIKTIIELSTGRAIVLGLVGIFLIGVSVGGYFISLQATADTSAKGTTPLALASPTIAPATASQPTTSPPSTNPPQVATPPPTSPPITSVAVPITWDSHSGVPETGTQISWSLGAGQVMFLGGGQFQIGDIYCGGDAQQICILIYKSSKSLTVVVNNVIPRQNYVGITTLSPEDALKEQEPMFWMPPNCGRGCKKATVLFFSDGQLTNKVTRTP